MCGRTHLKAEQLSRNVIVSNIEQLNRIWFRFAAFRGVMMCTAGVVANAAVTSSKFRSYAQRKPFQDRPKI